MGWKLVKGDLVLAELFMGEVDFPFLYGKARVTEHFPLVKPYFDLDAVTLTENLDDDHYEELDQMYEQMKAEGVRLVDPGGEPVAEFLLHIDGSDASFRYSYEPFETD